MAKKKIIKKKPRRVEEVKECHFCKENKKPDFLEYELLRRFMSERGKIQPRARSGICAKHQRRVSKEVKRARILGFLPFVVRPE